MSNFDKLVTKILFGFSLSYAQAERVLFRLGFVVRIRGSHHSFRKKGYPKTVTLTREKRLLKYQVDLVKEVLIDHGYIDKGPEILS